MEERWFRTKSDLFAAMPFACREDALLVAEDSVNPRKSETVKRYTAAKTAEDYLALLGLRGIGSDSDASRGGARVPLHRYEIVQSMTTPVFAFFDVDSPTPPAESPGSSDAESTDRLGARHRAVEAQVRRDLERHFGLPPGSGMVALSSSHSPSKYSVHAVVRFETTMEDLILDLAEIRSTSPLGAAYDNIYNRFRCFRAVGSSKHPGAKKGSRAAAPKPVLEPCGCGPAAAAMHVVRPLRLESGTEIAPPLQELPPDCPASTVRRKNADGQTGSAGRKRRPPGDAEGEGAWFPERADAERVAALVDAAMRSRLARDIRVASPVHFCFDKVTVRSEGPETETRAELSKRSFFCPGKGGYHSSNRALLILTEGLEEGRTARLKFVCLDSACRSANMGSVLLRTIEAKSDPLPSPPLPSARCRTRA